MIDAAKMRELAIDGLCSKLAADRLGIHPASYNGIPRSEHGNGWNECVQTLMRQVTQMARWLEALPENSKTLVEDLLLLEKMHVSFGENEQVKLWVDCSDTFIWGCADGEDITLEELPELVECYRLSPTYGGELWTARKRGMRPQTASYKECYPKSEWALFDACGPVRDDPDGQGREALD